MGASKGNKWESGIIPYVIDPSFTPINNLHAAFRAWEAATNLRFVRRLSIQEDYLSVQHTAEACFSSVGRQGGKQVVGCAPLGFGVGSLTHELGHAAGMIHEQQRSDRNMFVTIQAANIQAGREHNFARVSGSNNGAVYDFQSLMHYGANAFSNGGGPTIVPVIPGTPLNGSVAPTATDIAFINTLYPQLGVVRRSDSTSQGAGAISNLATVSFQGIAADRLMTAVRTASGTLRLIEWQISPLGGVARIADSANLAGAATDIDIARGPSSSDFVTACRTSSGTLKLIAWNDPGGTITRRGDSGSQAGAATQIKVVALTNTVFVSACRTSSGTLRLISWRLEASGALTRLADSANQAGAVSEIAMTVVRSATAEHIVATTVKSSSGRLLIITWRVRSDTGAITRRGDSGSAMGVAAKVKSTMTPSGHLLISCQSDAPARRLLLISFSINASGTTLTRRADSGAQAGRIFENALISRPYGAASAVSTASQTLRLIKWNVSGTGQITRAGDSADQAGEVGLISVAVLRGIGGASLLTPVRTSSGSLKLISWDDLSTSGELER